MVGKIYIIKNDINNKVYIGQTVQTLDERFKQHIDAAIKKRKHTKLALAIQELGAEHFFIELITNCDVEELNKLEIQYVKIYNSYQEGYNSTPGGDNGKSIYMGLDIEEFMDMYNNLTPVVEMAKHFNCSVKTIHKVRSNLGLEKSHGAFGNNTLKSASGTNKRIVQYDKYFNALKIYWSLADVIKENNGTEHWYYFIREACMRGNIAHGYRWQYLDELSYTLDNSEIYFNTIFDKQEYLRGNTDLIKLKTGAYKVKGIVYADYVGESARENCSVCGAKLNKNNQCDTCRINLSKQNKAEIEKDRLNKAVSMISAGYNLTQAGKELGMTANGLKKLLLRNGIDHRYL